MIALGCLTGAAKGTEYSCLEPGITKQHGDALSRVDVFLRKKSAFNRMGRGHAMQTGVYEKRETKMLLHLLPDAQKQGKGTNILLLAIATTTCCATHLSVGEQPDLNSLPQTSAHSKGYDRCRQPSNALVFNLGM